MNEKEKLHIQYEDLTLHISVLQYLSWNYRFSSYMLRRCIIKPFLKKYIYSMKVMLYLFILLT